MHQLFLQLLLNQIYKLADYLILHFRFFPFLFFVFVQKNCSSLPRTICWILLHFLFLLVCSLAIVVCLWRCTFLRAVATMMRMMLVMMLMMMVSIKVVIKTRPRSPWHVGPLWVSFPTFTFVLIDLLPLVK